MKLPYPLQQFGYKRSSQNDEDGIIAAILKHIKVQTYFVEFGAEPHEANCLELAKRGWKGLFMDPRGGPYIMKERVTPANVELLFHQYKVPDDFGVLSIDIDGQDIWVWKAIKQKPPLVVIEYNGGYPINKYIAMPRDDFYVWDGKDPHYGASLRALDIVGYHKGYHLVYANGTNAFFVRRNQFSNLSDFLYKDIYQYKTNGQLQAPNSAWYAR